MSDTQKDGGYCSKCDTVWVAPGKCNCNVGINPEDEKALKAAYKYESVLARNIWNEAIEAAALIVNNSDGFLHAETIRKLKK